MGDMVAAGGWVASGPRAGSDHPCQCCAEAAYGVDALHCKSFIQQEEAAEKAASTVLPEKTGIGPLCYVKMLLHHYVLRQVGAICGYC